MEAHLPAFSSEYEADRLLALENLQIIDGPRQPGFDKITSFAAELFEAPIAAISLIDKDTQWMRSRHGLDVKSTPREAAICNYTIQRHAPLIISDTREDERTRDNPYVTGPPFIRSYIGAPLITPEGYAIGALCVMSFKPREFSKRDVSLIESLAGMVMINVELSRQASIDYLTGSFNRRHFFTEMSLQTARGRRLQESSVLAIFDIDHFKSINDRHGHDVGDVVLREMVDLVHCQIRENDTFARVGGEEFALLFPNTRIKTIAPKINLLRQKISDYRFAAPLDLGVSISIGAVEMSLDQTDAENMRRADKALYHAKKSGRDTFALHTLEGLKLFEDAQL